MPAALAKFAGGGRSLLANPAVRKALPTALTLGAVALVAWAVFALRGGDYRPLYPGLGDADRAAVADALKAGGFATKIDGATGDVEVRDGDYHRARMALAAAGLPKAAPAGYDVLADLPLGVSRSVEAARLRQAQETDLARSIMAIDGVAGAEVHIAAAEPSAFLRDAAAPSASVFLRMAAGRTLGEGQAQAIVQLVASSVAGLTPEHISVVDQSGRLLSDAGDPALGAGRAQLAFQSRLEARTRERVAALLTPLVGPGNFSAEVHLDLDFAQTESTREQLSRDNVALRSEQGSSEGPSGGNGIPAGIPGALSNVAPPPTTVSATLPAAKPPAPPTAKDETYTRTYDVGRETVVSRPSPGAIERLSVAVLIKSGAGLTKKQIPELTQLVRDAVGFDARRGDSVSLSLQTFSKLAAVDGPPWYEAGWVSATERVGVPLIIALIATVGVARPLGQRFAAASEARARLLPAPAPPGAPQPVHRLEAVRVFVRDDRAMASRAIRQLVRDPS